MNPSLESPRPPVSSSSADDVVQILWKVWLMLQPFIVLSVVGIIFTIYGIVWKPGSPFLSSFRLTLIAEQTAIVAMGVWG